MPWPKPGATHYHAQLGHPDKDRVIKGLVVCHGWDLEPCGHAKRFGPNQLSNQRYESYLIMSITLKVIFCSFFFP